MRGVSLTRLADEQLGLARQTTAGRASVTVHGGRELALRQTLIVLAAGQELAEHNNPGEATLQVLRGHVRLSVAEDTWDGRDGDLVTIPSQRHALRAVEDSAVLLTVSIHGQS